MYVGYLQPAVLEVSYHDGDLSPFGSLCYEGEIFE